MISTALLASAPFRNITALQDYLGMLDAFRIALRARIFTLTGKSYVDYTVGDGSGKFALGYAQTRKWKDVVPSSDDLQDIQATFTNASIALGIPAPGDLTSFDLSAPSDWSSWTWQVSQTCESLRKAAGIV